MFVSEPSWSVYKRLLTDATVIVVQREHHGFHDGKGFSHT